MAEHPSPSSDMPLARSVLNKITETVDNFKLHSLPLISLYEQWKTIQSSFAMAEASMESRAKKLETDERRIESMLTEIRVREERLNTEIEDRRVELGLRAKEYDERFKILEFNETVVNGDLDVKEKRIRELEEALEAKKTGLSEELRVFEVRKRRIEKECRCLEAKEKRMVDEIEGFESRKRAIEEERRCLESKKKGMIEEMEKFESKKKGMVEEIRDLEGRERRFEERCRGLEAKEKGMVEEMENFESKKKGMVEEMEKFESKKKGMVEEFRELEEKERRVDERCRCLEAKEKGMVEEMENFESKKKGMVEEMEKFESKKKGMVEELRDLEERERRFEERCRGLEVKEKEIEERGRVEDLRGKEMNELEEVLEMRAKEILEECRVLEEMRKAVDGTSQGLDERSKVVELREKELVELQRKLELKEKNIDKGFEACCEELRLKKDELVESHRVLGLKEREIVEKCKELELKQQRINEQLKVLEVKENEISCRLKAVELKGKETMNDESSRVKSDDHCKLSVAVKEKQFRVADLKSVLIKKCTNLSKQADVLKQQYAEGKLAKDGCNVPGVKEVITENPQAENLAAASVIASPLSAEIQLVFRNDDTRATASYLTEHAETVSMWQKNILDLREEITGLLESLIAERKHLQAAMCTCVFEMKDVYPPEFLLNTHLEHVRERAKEIVKKASGTAQDDAANMELTALRSVLRCISDFKLESICLPAPHKLRITQLEKEMEVRTKPTKFLLRKKNNCDMGTKLEASDSATQSKTSSTPSLSAAISDSFSERKRKASSSLSVNQNKHHRSDSLKRPIPYYSHHPHVTPYRNHVLRPTHLLTTNWPGYCYPPPGVIYDSQYDIGSSKLVPRRYPGGFQTRPHYT